MVPFIKLGGTEADLSQKEKLLKKARSSPQNLTFKELCSLHEYFGMKTTKKGSGSSHRVYRRLQPPFFTLSIQSDKGKAPLHEVEKLLNALEDNGLLPPEDES